MTVSYRAIITDVSSRLDGYDVTFDVVDDHDAIVTTHTQGFPLVRSVVEEGGIDYEIDPDTNERREVTVTRTVETGGWEWTPQEVVEEAIQNYLRDVVPTLVSQPTVSVGHEIS